VEGDESAETFLEGRRPARFVKNWVFAADRLPGVSEATCRQRIVNESTEPLVGRLGDEVQRGHLV
jgi:hypothetical protein